MDSVNPSQRPSPSANAQQAQAAQAQDEASSSTNAANSELGGVAQDLGAVITKWENNLNSALNQWMSDIDSMTELIDDAKSVVKEMKDMIKAYQTYPNGLAFSESQYNRIVSAMTDLGIPESQIQGGTLGSDGYYDFTGTQFLNDIKMMGQYLVQDYPEFESQLSGYQQAETKDMMAVMFCYNSVKMNEQSLSGLLKTLTSLSQALMQNVQ